MYILLRIISLISAVNSSDTDWWEATCIVNDLLTDMDGNVILFPMDEDQYD